MKALRILILTGLSMFLFFSSAVSAPAAPSALSEATSAAPMAVPPGAPCSVSFYTLHARLRMAERDISDWEVRNAVSVSCQQGQVQWQWLQGTYRYYATYITVIMNSSGGVVTVYYTSGGGGGGWSNPVNTQE